MTKNFLGCLLLKNGVAIIRTLTKYCMQCYASMLNPECSVDKRIILIVLKAEK